MTWKEILSTKDQYLTLSQNVQQNTFTHWILSGVSQYKGYPVTDDICISKSTFSLKQTSPFKILTGAGICTLEGGIILFEQSCK